MDEIRNILWLIMLYIFENENIIYNSLIFYIYKLLLCQILIF